MFVILVPYYELLFRLYSGISSGAVPYLITLLFSLSHGTLVSLLCGLSKSTRANSIISGILLFIFPVGYLVQYFVYRSFNVFYDMNTMTNGAGQAFADFGPDIRRIVINPEGISAIILFYLPFILFVLLAITGHHKPLTTRVTLRRGMLLIVSAIVSFSLGRLTVFLSDIYEPMYTSEYNYQNAVSSMGLITSIRLDLMHLVSGKNDGFVIDEDEEKAIAVTAVCTDLQPVSPSEAAQASAVIPDADDLQPVSQIQFQAQSEPVIEEHEPVYGPNSLDIDFNALSENASGQEKELDLYVDSIEPSMQNEFTGLFKGKNLIFLTAEAFSGYLIDPELTPALYRLATKGIQIPDYYQPASAGTTGGEYSNLFGMIPTAGGKSMKRITEHNTWITIGNRLNNEGYYGRAYHDNIRTVYDRDVTHEKLGYSDGYVGVGNGMEEYLHTSGFPASDLEMLQGTFPTYVDKQPFNIYYMTVSGHGQYGRSINQMASKNYSRVADLDHSEIVKCYLACNMPLEDAMAWLIDELENRGIADDTVIVISADHFPYNLDTGAAPGNMPNLSELYGFEVTNYLERDSNRLIIWSGCLEKMDPIVVYSPVFSLDILPTLCNLFGVPYESRLLPGRDIFSDKEALVFDGGYDWKTSLGTFIASRNKFTPVSEDTVVPEDYVTAMKTEVKNRMNYCKGVLNCGYFDHVFGTDDP